MYMYMYIYCIYCIYCIYVYMYICIYVYMCICIYVYMYICIYVYMYICICIYMYMYKCIYVFLYICIYVYLYICIYVYLYLCIYVYIATKKTKTRKKESGHPRNCGKTSHQSRGRKRHSSLAMEFFWFPYIWDIWGYSSQPWSWLWLLLEFCTINHS